MKKEEDLIWESYITESPWLIPDMPADINNDYEKSTVNDIENKASLYDKFENYNIYIAKKEDENDVYELFFISQDKLMIYYRYKKYSEYIQTEMIWNTKDKKGLFRYVFINYIIPKFNIVKSDFIMNNSGFEFWKKIFNEYQNRFQFKVVDERENYIRPINSIRDIELAKQKFNSDNVFSQFLIQNR